MLDVNNDVLDLFNSIVLDIRDYLFDRSLQTGEKFICESQTYKTVIFWLSDKCVAVYILKDIDNNDFIRVYIGNKYDKMFLISTSKNNFTVNCIPDILPYTSSGKSYFTYSWKGHELENFINIARTRFHEFEVKCKAKQKEHDYKMSKIVKMLEESCGIDELTYNEVDELCEKVKCWSFNEITETDWYLDENDEIRCSYCDEKSYVQDPNSLRECYCSICGHKMSNKILPEKESCE